MGQRAGFGKMPKVFVAYLEERRLEGNTAYCSFVASPGDHDWLTHMPELKLLGAYRTRQAAEASCLAEQKDVDAVLHGGNPAVL